MCIRDRGKDGGELLKKLEERGIPKDRMDVICHSGIKLEEWLSGFGSVEDSVKETVLNLKQHPLMPEDITVRGFIMDSVTGALSAV